MITPPYFNKNKVLLESIATGLISNNSLKYLLADRQSAVLIDCLIDLLANATVVPPNLSVPKSVESSLKKHANSIRQIVNSSVPLSIKRQLLTSNLPLVIATAKLVSFV